MEQLWTLREVCVYMRCSEPTIRRWLAESRRGAGTFPLPVQEKKGGKLLFDPQALSRWVEDRQAMPKQANPVRASKQEKDKNRRLKLAHTALERHRKPKQEKTL